MLKIAVIGLGEIAQKAYLPIYGQMKNVEFHLYTRSPEKLRQISEQYRFAKIHQTLDSIIRAGVAGAFVHTATSTHPEIISHLLKAQIPVYVDKPIADHYQEAKKVTELAKAQGVLLMTGFNRRFAPMIRQLKEKPNINMIILQKNRNNQPLAPREFIFDDFIHVVDTLLYLMDGPLKQMAVYPVWSGNLLSSLTVQLMGANKAATALMNRESGVNEELVTVFTSSGKYQVENLVALHHYKGSSCQIERFDDWETTLYKRGFEPIVMEFLQRVRNQDFSQKELMDSLYTHEICEKILEGLSTRSENIPLKS